MKLKLLATKSNCYDEYEMFSADDLIEKLVTESLKEVTDRHHQDESKKKPSGKMKGKRKRGAISTDPMEDNPNRKNIRMQVLKSKRNKLQK